MAESKIYGFSKDPQVVWGASLWAPVTQMEMRDCGLEPFPNRGNFLKIGRQGKFKLASQYVKLARKLDKLASGDKCHGSKPALYLNYTIAEPLLMR